MAYDEKGLYLAGQFVDASPLVNHNDPSVDPFRGWAGDALNIRMVADATVNHPVPAAKLNADQISHLMFWYFTDKQLPALDVRHGWDFHGVQTLTGKQIALQYRKTSNGYTMEACVPWSLLKVAQSPRPGDRWIFTMQPLWGDAAGQMRHYVFDVVSSGGFPFQSSDSWGYAYFVKSEKVAATLKLQAAEEARTFGDGAAQSRPTIPVRYTNPSEGFVSLAICKPDGQIVRTLLAKAKRSAGAQTEAWDGLDDDGKPVPRGDYQLKALAYPGLTPKFITSVHNSGNPSWG